MNTVQYMFSIAYNHARVYDHVRGRQKDIFPLLMYVQRTACSSTSASICSRGGVPTMSLRRESTEGSTVNFG